MPGRHAFLFAELTDKGPVPLYASGANERFAIGSSFKLFILGALIDEVNQGKRRSEDILLLRRDLIGPPASDMASWPVGSPATLYTYALKMISISDNTAADHLLYLLGRRRIEEQMKAMGHSDPSVNRPLLSTREMVMLRDRKAPGRAAKWRKLDNRARGDLGLKDQRHRLRPHAEFIERPVKLWGVDRRQVHHDQPDCAAVMD